jgi:hypothetical protein
MKKTTNRGEEKRISCGVCPCIKGCTENANNRKPSCMIYGNKHKKEPDQDSNSKRKK